jgi:hypothetical protein
MADTDVDMVASAESPNKFGWHIFLGLTITFTRIVASALVGAGITYAFLFHEAATTGVLVGAGVSLFVGRSAVDKMGAPNPFGALAQDHEVVIRRPQPRASMEVNSK